MDGGDVKPSYYELFSRICPEYMLYGATYEDFWYGDTRKLKAIREKYKKEMEQRNYDAWLQGAYFFDAINVSLANAFAKKGAKQYQYTKQFEIFPPTQEELERRQEEKNKQMYEQLLAMTKASRKSEENK